MADPLVDDGDEDDPVAMAEAKARAWQRQLLQKTALCDNLEDQLRSSEEVRQKLADDHAALREEQLKRGGRSGGGALDAEAQEKLRTVRRVLTLDKASLSEMKREIGIFKMEVTSLFSGGFGPVAAMTRAAEEHAERLRNAEAAADALRAALEDEKRAAAAGAAAAGNEARKGRRGCGRSIPHAASDSSSSSVELSSS